MFTILRKPSMRKPAALLLWFSLAGALSACAGPTPQVAVLKTAPVIVTAVQAQPPAIVATVAAISTTGTASWYRTGGRLHRCYTGERLNNNAYTAASSNLPMGTMVRVGLVDDSRSVVVRVNDRMPHNHRLIDLSEIAARELGLINRGLATVTVTPIMVASAQ
jgi:rare lipoprotein A